MNACPAGLSVKSAGSERGIGNIFLRFVMKAQAIFSRSIAVTPTRGCRPGQIRRERIDQLGISGRQDDGELAAPTDPRQGDGNAGLLPCVDVWIHSFKSSISRLAEGVWPRSTLVGTGPAAVGNDVA